MEHLRWSSRPALRKPVVIAAFEGWNDAGDAASTAARWLRDRFAPRVFAEIDPEEFFDFTTTRPQVRMEDGVRRIDWPLTDLSAGAEGGRDVVVVLGSEPQLRWRTFCEQVLSVVRQLDARLVVTLGALLAEVPHTRPVRVIGTAENDDLIERLRLHRSTYEGPTGIVGVLQDQCRSRGVPSLSLWAAVPTYVSGPSSPAAALALVRRVADLLAAPIDTSELEAEATAYVRRIDEVVADDEDLVPFLARLESAYDEETPVGTDLIEEVERFLRDQQ